MHFNNLVTLSTAAKTAIAYCVTDRWYVAVNFYLILDIFNNTKIQMIKHYLSPLLFPLSVSSYIKWEQNSIYHTELL